MDITNYLREKFIPTDNIPRDTDAEEAIHMEAKASLLIEVLAAKRKLHRFLNSGKRENGLWYLPLPNPIVFHQEVNYQDYKMIFDEFIIYTGKIPEEDIFGQSGRIRLAIKMPWCKHIQPLLNCPRLSDCESGCRTRPILKRYDKNNQPIFAKKDLQIKSFIENAVSKFQELSAFELCQSFTRYNTPEEICSLTKNDALGFASLNVDSNNLYQDIFYNHEVAECDYFQQCLQNSPRSLEEDMLQQILNNFVLGNRRYIDLSAAHEKNYFDWLQQVFSFENENGEVAMKALRLYSQSTQSKMFIAVTSWQDEYLNRTQHCVPLAGKQMLIHQKDILQSKNPTVILVDSPDIAVINQPHTPKGIVWTSYLCNPEKYDQIDFTPLQDDGEVYILITNHSGISLAQNYRNQKPLVEYLQKQYGIDLKIVQLEIDYHENIRFFFENISDIVDHQQQFTPQIIPGSVMEMDSPEKFEKMHDKAAQSLNMLPFWHNRYGKNEEIIEIDTTPSAINYCMRPFVFPGGLTKIYAFSGIGKSAFTYSYCAAIVARKKFLPERWWVPSKNNVKIPKVLYLDFEMDSNSISKRRVQLIDPYFSGSTENKKKLHDNFIIESLKDTPIDCTQNGNHQKIFDLIELAKDKGNKLQAVDVIVFDTYTKMIDKRDTQDTWGKILPMLRKIQNMGIAIIIVHHATRSGTSRGFMEKLDDFDAILKLSKKSKNATNWEEPMLIEVEKGRRNGISFDLESFTVKRENKLWQVASQNCEEIQAFGKIVEEYKHDYKDEDIWKIMGIGKTMFYEKMKEFKEKYG